MTPLVQSLTPLTMLGGTSPRTMEATVLATAARSFEPEVGNRLDLSAGGPEHGRKIAAAEAMHEIIANRKTSGLDHP